MLLHAQQAAEKALKAVCERVRVARSGRNLNLLVRASAGQVAVPEDVRTACARLNRYYIPTRYPDAFDEGAPADQFFAADAQQAVRDAEEVVRFAVRLIGPS